MLATNCSRNQLVITRKPERLGIDEDMAPSVHTRTANENQINGCRVWRGERTVTRIGCATSIILEPEEDL